MSIQDTIDNTSMGKRQIGVVAICLAILMTEGYDLLLMAFAAPAVSQEWGLTSSQVGLLLSSVFIGMALGAATLAPLADKIGRRKLTLLSLGLILVSMIGAVLTQGYIQLGFCRFVTGLGVGSLAASLPVVIAEFSPSRRRGTMIALYTTGMPLGGVIGGAVAGLFIGEYGWRFSFAVGAVLTLLMLIVAYFKLPESLDYLLERRPPGALEKINVVLKQIGKPPLTALPDAQIAKQQQSARAIVLSSENALRTVLVWAVFFLIMAAFYVAVSWTPTLLVQSGFSAKEGVSGGALMNLGGVVGTLTFSALALIISVRKLAVGAVLLASVVFYAMSASIGHLTGALWAAVAVGFFMNASGSGAYALVPGLYPASVRSTAVGWATAVGRLGAIISPIVVGVLVDKGWSPGALFQLFTIPLLVAALGLAAASSPHKRITGIRNAKLEEHPQQ